MVKLMERLVLIYVEYVPVAIQGLYPVQIVLTAQVYPMEGRLLISVAYAAAVLPDWQ
jgi:hypothetical protein